MKLNYKHMKTYKHLILCVSVLAFGIMAGCDNKAKPTTKDEPQPEMTAEDGVDWSTALYEIDGKGDTTKRYDYNSEGKLAAEYDYYDNKPVYWHDYGYDGNGNLVSSSSYYEGNLIGGETRVYDGQNRLIRYEYEEEADGGVSQYTYEGNKRIERSEDALSETVYQDVTETYYDAQGNDTLVIRRSARVREHSDSDCDYDVTPVVYMTRKVYADINGEQRLKSSVRNEVHEDGTAILREQDDYEYDNMGRLVSYSHFDDFGDGCPISNEKTTYKYYDNCRENQNGDKTYYKLKDR